MEERLERIENKLDMLYEDFGELRTTVNERVHRIEKVVIFALGLGIGTGILALSNVLKLLGP